MTDWSRLKSTFAMDQLSDAEFKKAVAAVAREIDADSDKSEVYNIAKDMGYNSDDARHIASELRG